MKSTKRELKDKATIKGCGMITCIHCIGNKCSIDKCDFYERVYSQED